MLVWQLLAAREAPTDRFYRALYAGLANDALTASSKAPMFLGLLFKVGRAPATLAPPGVAFVRHDTDAVRIPGALRTRAAEGGRGAGSVAHPSAQHARRSVERTTTLGCARGALIQRW